MFKERKPFGAENKFFAKKRFGRSTGGKCGSKQLAGDRDDTHERGSGRFSGAVDGFGA